MRTGRNQLGTDMCAVYARLQSKDSLKYCRAIAFENIPAKARLFKINFAALVPC